MRVSCRVRLQLHKLFFSASNTLQFLHPGSSHRRGYHNAIKKYNDAIQAAGDVKEALAPALLNRAVVEFKLENYGRALQDVEKSLSLSPGNIKAHYRYAIRQALI